ncbi:MAG TPA: antibiotic biosynthesis monooxygenase [Gemmatimonadaceae bacterium]|nr:antibiotic biosynthesis monooxygenase [Gemmatimonadaceae bacterium]
MLFARHVTFSAKKSAIDEAIGLYQNSVIPAASEQKGFRGAVLLTDRANARATSITFWESEADLLQGEKSGYYKKQIDALRPFMADEPVRTVYEVSAQTALQMPAVAGGPGVTARR